MAVERLFRIPIKISAEGPYSTTRPCDSQSADEQFWETRFGSCEARTRMPARTDKSCGRLASLVSEGSVSDADDLVEQDDLWPHSGADAESQAQHDALGVAADSAASSIRRAR